MLILYQSRGWNRWFPKLFSISELFRIFKICFHSPNRPIVSNYFLSLGYLLYSFILLFSATPATVSCCICLLPVAFVLNIFSLCFWINFSAGFVPKSFHLSQIACSYESAILLHRRWHCLLMGQILVTTRSGQAALLRVNFSMLN